MTTCPSLDQLELFLDDGLNSETERAITAHIQKCETCKQALTRLALSIGDGESNLTNVDQLRQWLCRPGIVPLPPEHSVKTQDEAPFLPANTTIGQYVVLGDLGRGGFGTVYLVADTRLHRRAALKLLDGRQVTAADREQFATEARAAARVEHTHVVKIFDVGDAAEGVPYFVMEFIDGRSVAERLQANGPFPIRDAIDVIRQAALGLEAIHEKGLIHRDIKPSNLLQDQRTGCIKIVDFGLARSTDGSASSSTAGHFRGTVRYASPERHRGLPQDARADIFSLGIVLYEILTGRRPFDAASDIDVELLLLGTFEPTSPRTLNRAVTKDLETITLKCLEKKPERRYSAAAELAAELQACLDNRPIVARPVSGAERAWRWCQRRPGISGLLVAILLIVIVSASLLFRQLRQTEQARDLADEGFGSARVAVQKFFTDVSESDDLRGHAFEPFRRGLLETARSFYEEFVRQRGDDPSLKLDLALAHFRLGFIKFELQDFRGSEDDYGLAIRQFEQLLRDQPRSNEVRDGLGKTRHHLATLYHATGRSVDAEKACRIAIRAHNELVQENPDNLDYKRALARYHGGLAIVLAETRKPHDAESEFRESLEILEPLVQQYPKVWSVRSDLAKTKTALGNVCWATGRIREAEQWFKEALPIQEHLVKERPGLPAYQFDLASSRYNLAKLYFEGGLPNEAEVEYGLSLQIVEKLNDLHPEVPEYRFRRAQILGSLARVYRVDGRVELATNAYNKGVSIYESLIRDFTNVPDYEHGLAADCQAMGNLCAVQGKVDEAKDWFQRAIGIWERLIERIGSADYRSATAQTFTSVGTLNLQLNQLDEAKATFQKALSILEALVQKHPKVVMYTINLAHTLSLLGEVDRSRGAFDESRDWFDKCLQTISKLPEEPRKSPFVNSLESAVKARLVSSKKAGDSTDSQVR